MRHERRPMTRGVRRYLRASLHRSKPFAVVRNPKTGEYLFAFWEKGSLAGIYTVTLYRATSRGVSPYERVGYSDLICDAHRDYLQIHTVTREPGRGYGAALYLTGAVFAGMKGYEGVESPVPPHRGHERSEDASRFWEKARALRVAHRVRTVRGLWDRMDSRNAAVTGLVRVLGRKR